MTPKTCLVALLAMGACTDLPEIRYETEYLDIGTDFDAPLCRGTLDDLDAQARRAEAVLEYSIDDRLQIYIFQDGPGDLCDFTESGGGCFDLQTSRAYTSLGAARHEVVHAATEELGTPNHFFSEGLTVALTGNMIGFFWSDPSSNLGLDPDELSYGTAAHFGRWMLDEYPASELRRLYRESSSSRGASHARKAFVDSFGHKFSTAEGRYFDDSPEFYRTVDIVPVPIMEADEPGRWTSVIEFDCDSAHTRGSDRGRVWRELQIDVETAGWYVLETGALADAKLEIRRTDDIPAGVEPPHEPLSPVGEEWNQGAEWIDGGTPTPVLLDAASYLLTMRVESLDPELVEVRLHPKFTDVPATPD